MGAATKSPWGLVSDVTGTVFRARRVTIRVFFCHACFQVIFLQIFESESGRLGLPKQTFGVRGVAKTNFSQKTES